MEIIEFQTTIKNGVIEIPPEYREKVKKRMRVILIPAGKEGRRPNLIDQLLQQPMHVDNFQMLSRDEIYRR